MGSWHTLVCFVTLRQCHTTRPPVFHNGALVGSMCVCVCVNGPLIPVCHINWILYYNLGLSCLPITELSSAWALRQTAVTNVFQGRQGAPTLNHTPLGLRSSTRHPHTLSCESAVMQPRGADAGQRLGVNMPPPPAPESLPRPGIQELLSCVSTPHPIQDSSLALLLPSYHIICH